jgi:YgiT-type zinc finger domain-containing protein
VTVTLPKNEATLIFKLVPAEVCENCGEYYLSEETTTKLMDQARQALKEGTEVEIKRFAA